MLNNMAKEGEKSTLPKIEGTSEMNHHINTIVGLNKTEMLM